MESIPFTKGPTNRGARRSMFFALPHFLGNNLEKSRIFNKAANNCYIRPQFVGK